MKRREFLKVVGFGVAGLALPLGGCGNSNAPKATDLQNLLSLRKDMADNIENKQFDAAERSYERLRWLANSADTLHGHTLGTFAGCYLGHWLYLFGHESQGGMMHFKPHMNMPASHYPISWMVVTST